MNLPQDARKVQTLSQPLTPPTSMRKKVALVFVCVNEPYWPYLKQVLEDCDKYFLTNRRTEYQVDYFAWTDIPEDQLPNATVIPTAPVGWPAPTLMRYHLFLNEEERLSTYDYIFYLDADMRVVSAIGEEIMGPGLTMAEHPMYALHKRYFPPYEPNPKSKAYIPRPGMIVKDEETGRERFKPLYVAGGFQGGTSQEFIKAMKIMKKNIDWDFDHLNYTAIWNDESHWNRYLYDYHTIGGNPINVLGPECIYPDSLIKEYYEPLWGRSYQPKIVTLTKPFSLTKEGGMALRQFLGGPKQALLACPTCNDQFTADMKIQEVLTCGGAGKPHQVKQHA